MKKIIVLAVLTSLLCAGCLPRWMLPSAKVADTIISTQIAAMEAAAASPDSDSAGKVIAALEYVHSQANPNDELSLSELKDHILKVVGNSPTYDSSISEVRAFVDLFMESLEKYIETQDSLFKKNNVQLTTLLTSMIQALKSSG